MAEARAIESLHDGPGKAPPINPPRSPLRRPRTWAGIVAAVVILAVAIFVWGPWRTARVTDGSEVLASNLAQVENLIQLENSKVTSSGRQWVSIALMLPVRTTDDARNNPKNALHHLEGAYLAQYWSNHPNGDDKFGNDMPLIRLLIADTGQDGQDWKDTVAELVKKADPKSGEYLVAVAGLGLSTDATQSAVDALAAANIPMVGSVITATGLTAPPERNPSILVRVAPTNSDEAAAAIKYLSTTPDWKSATVFAPYRAYLVQDRRPDDTFVKDLGDKYRQEFRNNDTHTLLDIQGDYDSKEPGAGNAIQTQITTICSVKPRVVFFAGRADGLKTFLNKLSTRPCPDLRITVVSGDSASGLIGQTANPLWIDSRGNLDVLYTGLASPQAWQEKYQDYVLPAAARQFVDRCDQCFKSLFSESFDDGDAIMSHDAILTAVAAARNVASADEPTAGALINGLYQINAGRAVPGASGWIYYQREPGAPNGVPYHKAVPIMQLNPDGTARLVSLLSRSGAPAVPSPTG